MWKPERNIIYFDCYLKNKKVNYFQIIFLYE